jgi:drug/metabolite transporter (DMT)-like permease
MKDGGSGSRQGQGITSKRAVILLAMAIVVLGTNWPTLKIAMRAIEPLWFNTLRMLCAALVYATILAVRGRLVWPSRQDVPMVLGLGLLQFGIMSCMVAYGVATVGAGRSAILVYTNSIWVTTGAVLFLGERISRWQIVGMVFGLAGIAILFSPLDLDWTSRKVLIGNGSVVFGAMFWSAALLQVRGHRWHADPLELLPHQTALGALVSLPFAMILEGPVPKIQWAWQPVTAFAIVVLFATCLSFWALVTAGRRLPAIAVSLGQLATPVIGVISASILVAEVPSPADIAGLALIVFGVALAAILGRRRAIRA